MGLLSRDLVRRAAPVAIAGVAGAAGALLARRRLGRQAELTAGPVAPAPIAETPLPTPPSPAPPTPTPDPGPPPAPTPDPGPPPAPTPDPEPPAVPPTPEPPAPEPEPTPVAAAPAPAQTAPAPSVAEPSAAERELAGAVDAALAAPLATAGGDVEVEVAERTVVLRGRVDSPEAIRELKSAAAAVPGVERVRVLLHLPGSAARRR